jgi:hypothetical protein
MCDIMPKYELDGSAVLELSRAGDRTPAKHFADLKD